MKTKNLKKTILISLLAVGVIWNLFFLLPIINSELSRFINSKFIMDMIADSYDNFLSPQVCILVSFVNLWYAVVELYSEYKVQKSSVKRFVGYWIYAIGSVAALVIHCISFNYVFSCLVAG